MAIFIVLSKLEIHVPAHGNVQFNPAKINIAAKRTSTL